VEAIEAVEVPDYRKWFLVVFSSIIAVPSGGVSKARDLAHSRPHKVADKAPKSAISSIASQPLRRMPMRSF